MIRLPYVVWCGKPSPVVEVTLKRGKDRVRTTAYVDTGASFSFFHSDFCSALGLDLKKGAKMEVRLGDGDKMPVYVHRVGLRIETLEVRCDIVFSKRLGSGINILGRQGLLDKYKVTFDGKRKEIVWYD
ncbi:MAG: aspartyl protease family protein [Euryarchaeota archaeon]|nr:aspartyl protease family protein [Euryarchaeota archaeon]